tara:strand:- start:400 stop:1020 length:621 start_codon:yes stop_codon:yes gene_type:complete
MNFKDKISGIVLCGGLSRRMGSDKSQKKIGDLKLIDIVIEKASLQVSRLALNAENLKSEKFNLELVPDCKAGNLGPLIGILSGLLWTKKNNSEWLMVFPVDSPFFPNNIVESFVNGLSDEKIVMAKSNNKLHPVFSMWSVELISDLEFAINNNQRKIDLLIKKIPTRLVNFNNIGYDPFFNVNNADDLYKAKEIYREFFENKRRIE